MLVEIGGHVFCKDLAHSIAKGLVIFVIRSALACIEHRRSPSGGQQAREALADQALRFRHDAVDQFLAGGNIVDQSRHHAA